MNEIPETYHGKPLIHTWTYRDQTGEIIGHVARYQDGGKKDIVPYFKRNGTSWIAGIDLNPRPLFGHDQLTKHPKGKAVFVVEGEKCAAALQSLGVTALTSMGGSQAAKLADWTPLSSHKMVYLLPDKDDPGEHYMKDVYGALAALPEPPQVKVVRLAGLPDKGDVVDWLQGWVDNWDSYAPIAEKLHEPLKKKLRVEIQKAERIPEEWTLHVDRSQKSNWETPVEITVKLKPVKPFDLKLLPDSFKPWVQDTAFRMGCPIDYVAVSAMVALSALVGKKGTVHPKKHDDWTVCPNTWGLNIGRPSWLKTPASQEGTKALVRLEIEAKANHEEALAADGAQEFINKEGRALAEKAAKGLIKNKKFAEAAKLLI